MAKTVLFISMSLDGYLADHKGNIDFLTDVEIKEEDKSYEEFYKDVRAVVMGRVTYDQVITTLSPLNYPYSKVDSFVITSKHRENLQGVTFENRSVVDVVLEKKKQYDKTLWIVGGSSLIQPLIEHDLIDEYYIAIIPVLLGGGIPLFKKFNNTIKLSVKDHYVKNNMAYLVYERR